VIFIPSLNSHKTVISVVTSFGAGIFLVVGLSHLIAEGADIMFHEYPESTHEHDNERFRPAYMTAIAGYLFMVFLQRGIFKSDFESGDVTKTIKAELEKKKEQEQKEKEKDAEMKSTSPVEGTAVDVQDNGAAEADDVENSEAFQTQAKVTLGVMFVGLFIHGIMEGIVLGIQDTKEGVILVFIAIVAHHWGADLIFSFATGKVKALTIPMRLGLSIFCSMNAPIGIAIGWALSNNIPSLATAYILSFSGGTFLMIALTEIVPAEMPVGKRSLPQIVAATLGVGVMYMAITLVYSEEAHDH
jgi:zinc transporter ZupT